MFSSEQGLKYFTHAIYYKGNREKKTKKMKKKKKSQRKREQEEEEHGIVERGGEKEKFGIGATERELGRGNG